MEWVQKKPSNECEEYNIKSGLKSGRFFKEGGYITYFMTRLQVCTSELPAVVVPLSLTSSLVITVRVADL